jgi:hypothetical protein
LSPLGGQASLRVISTGPHYTNTSHNFTYLAFSSPFTNQGIGSSSAEALAPINAAFTSFLTTSAASKASAQDPYGNIKIPIYENLQGTSDWRTVPDGGDVIWSSLTGIPIHELPTVEDSHFNMNTGYMTTSCKVSGEAVAASARTMQSLSNLTQSLGGWSGANFAIEVGRTDQFAPTSFVFRSLALQESTTEPKPLTVANCSVNMNYVEVQISCNKSICRPEAIRPSTQPASHSRTNLTSMSIKLDELTPLNGLGQLSIMYTSFWKNFIDATNPSVGCDTTFCTTSGIEGYLANPDSPYSFINNPVLWTVGEELISQRFTQLLNTYWIDSIGPLIIGGSFTNLTKDSNILLQNFNTDSFVGSLVTEVEVIKCNSSWLGILLVSSIMLLLNAVGIAVVTRLRRGPDILDRFSSLLRDNRFIFDLDKFSMEDAFNQSRRLGNSRVQFGDIQPERDIGYAAIALMDGNTPLQRLQLGRVYA